MIDSSVESTSASSGTITPKLEEKIEQVDSKSSQETLLTAVNDYHWSTEEEDRLMEAIRLYGRRWPKLAEHVGTRSVR